MKRLTTYYAILVIDENVTVHIYTNFIQIFINFAKTGVNAVLIRTYYKFHYSIRLTRIFIRLRFIQRQITKLAQTRISLSLAFNEYFTLAD